MEQKKGWIVRIRQILYTKASFSYLRITANQRLKPRKRLRFETDVVDHCNLNCKSCHHFSSVADQYFVKKEIFEKDFARLSKLAGRNNENIDIMGGEPLLHPEISKLVEIARKYFDGPINIVTNGILLEKMNAFFWESCEKNNIRIIVSSYPIKLNVKRIKELAKKHSVKLKIRSLFMSKNSWCKLPFDLDGNQSKTENSKLCLTINKCNFLKNGRLSTCCLPLIADRFNNYFGKDTETEGFGKTLEVTDDDYIDIYKAKNIEEIYEFLSKPMPFCRYCRIKSWEIGIEWGVTKKEITEWI
ncbi:MAG: 4Fe-4S cluster-binding domain-containing protein [Treponema sp.]|nr:4Fe-4S cluster-binding domain-containing protein [Treponema sp.]